MTLQVNLLALKEQIKSFFLLPDILDCIIYIYIYIYVHFNLKQILNF